MFFVANRIEQIWSFSTPSQWRHIEGESNPADIASRGISAAKLIQSELWFNGPGFLWKDEALPESNTSLSFELDDPEVKKSTVLATHAADLDIICFQHVSDWYHLERAVALCMKLKDRLRKKAQARKQGLNLVSDKSIVDSITVEDLQRAESEIVRTVQREVFGRLRPGDSVSKRSPLHKVDVSVDEHGIIRLAVA